MLDFLGIGGQAVLLLICGFWAGAWASAFAQDLSNKRSARVSCVWLGINIILALMFLNKIVNRPIQNRDQVPVNATSLSWNLGAMARNINVGK